MRVEKAGEKDLSYDQLDSKDAFILDASSGGLFVWVGKDCTLEERKKAMEYASEYLRQAGRPAWAGVVRVLESAEPNFFLQWFAKPPTNQKKQFTFKPKLFQCSDETGKIVIEEIVDFDQDDLDGEDVMVLDTSEKLYVWVGSGASDKEKAHALYIAKKYLDGDAMPRPPNARIVPLAQGAEPSDFTKHFKNWNPDANAFAGHTIEAATRA